MSDRIEIGGTPPSPWHPRHILPWWPVIVATITALIWVVRVQVGTEKVLERVTDVQASIASMRAEMAILPRLAADAVNLDRRQASIEKRQDLQEERTGRLGEAVGDQRQDMVDLRGQVRSLTEGGRLPLTQPAARSGR
jgi:uncharacterized coiled-coil protein SlyX